MTNEVTLSEGKVSAFNGTLRGEHVQPGAPGYEAAREVC